MTATFFDQWTKFGKTATEPMVEYATFFTKVWSDFTKQGLQAGSEFVKSQSDQLGALAQTKTPEEYFAQQAKYFASQAPKTVDYFTKTLDTYQEALKESNKIFQKQMAQFTKTDKNTTTK